MAGRRGATIRAPWTGRRPGRRSSDLGDVGDDSPASPQDAYAAFLGDRSAIDCVWCSTEPDPHGAMRHDRACPTAGGAETRRQLMTARQLQAAG